ncbi:ABC transporter substrate-binding protein [Kribbella sp. WER1]
MLQSLRLTESSTALKFAPQYVALDLGWFADAGLDVSIDVDAGPAGSWLAENLATGRADVALGGVWLPLLYDQLGRQRLRSFAVLCHRNPAVLLSREPVDEPWSWTRLHGHKVLMSLAATSQWMFLEGVLREHDVDMSRVKFVRDLHVDTTRELWRAGYADFYLVEPLAATQLIGEGSEVATTMAEAAGPVPWSVYYASEEFLTTNRDTIDRFRSVLQRASTWLLEQDVDTVVEVLRRRFASEDLGWAVRHFRTHGIWQRTPDFDQDALRRYQRMMLDYGLLDPA